MGPLSKKNIELILNEESSFDIIKSAIDSFYDNFSTITNISGKMERPEPATILSSGSVQSTKTSAGSMLDYVKTTKFLRGIKEEIAYQLKSLNKKSISILYASPGPFAPLLIPLLPLYGSEQLKISLLEYHEDSINGLEKIISDHNLKDYIDKIENIDPSIYENPENKLFDIIIIENIQKALSVEPQVALTNHLSNYVSEDGALIPKEIKISAQLADLHSELSFAKSKWTNFWLNIKRKSAKERRILLDEIFILNINSNKNENFVNHKNNLIELPKIIADNKIGSMTNLILLTEIHITDDIILTEEDSTGSTGLFYDKDLLPVEPGMELKFFYQLGSQPRIVVEQN